MLTRHFARSFKHNLKQTKLPLKYHCVVKYSALGNKQSLNSTPADFFGKKAYKLDHTEPV